MQEVYRFPNGFQNEARSMYGWLRNYNLNPQWGPWVGGASTILLPAGEVSCLRLMQKANPARFGNCP